jgi:cell division protein FtsB
MLLAGIIYERFTQSAIRTALKGASGTLSIQQHLSALETTIAELKTSNAELKTMNDQLRTTNERMITKICQLETSLADVFNA